MEGQLYLNVQGQIRVTQRCLPQADTQVIDMIQVLQEHLGTTDAHLHWVLVLSGQCPCRVCLMLHCSEHLKAQQPKGHSLSRCPRCPKVLGGEDLRI